MRGSRLACLTITLAACAPAAPRPDAPASGRAPTDAEVRRLFAEGVEAHASGDFDEAIRSWEEVRRHDADHENVAELLLNEYTVRGLEHFTEGDLDRAVNFWEKARAIRPGDRRIRAYLERAREQREHAEKLPAPEEPPDSP